MVVGKQWFTSERHVLIPNVDLCVLEIHQSWQSTLVFFCTFMVFLESYYSSAILILVMFSVVIFATKIRSFKYIRFGNT